ncbi:MAG: hypothetical protein K2H89_09450, partial [Oscillospiraceae bacterium]|nr:hypothetical protein [Oscillospiraceae bacterium]
PVQTTAEPVQTTAEPVQTTAEPVQTTTEPIVIGDAGMWIIGTDTVAPGATVTIPVTVTGDKNGINSFIMKMGNPGKDGITPTPESAEKGNAYGEAMNFVPNIANMTFGSTNFTLGENVMLTEDGAVVFNVTFTAPTEPGTYDLTFEDLSVYDINMSLLTPEKKDGWIKVVAESTTTSEPLVQTTAEPVQTTAAPVDTTAAPVDTTAAPVDTTAAPVDTTAAPVDTTAAPVQTTAEPVQTTTEPIVIGDSGMWIIGTDTVAPGATVTIPVTVTGDKNGINSFIMKMGNPGKGGVTPTPESAEKGNAYGEAMNFVPNIANMTFGSTNFTLGENVMLTEDGAVVFNVTFTAPTEPGTYDLTFEDLSVYDINMSLLTPEKKDGWIKVVAESTTTSEQPVQTTTTSEEPVPVQTT